MAILFLFNWIWNGTRISDSKTFEKFKLFDISPGLLFLRVSDHDYFFDVKLWLFDFELRFSLDIKMQHENLKIRKSWFGDSRYLNHLGFHSMWIYKGSDTDQISSFSFAKNKNHKEKLTWKNKMARVFQRVDRNKAKGYLKIMKQGYLFYKTTE